MRKEVSSDYSIFCEAAGKAIHWKVSIKKTTDISEPHSEGTWIDVTDYLASDIPEKIANKTEASNGQPESDQLKFVGLDIEWWKNNIFNYEHQLELKIDFWINNLTADNITPFAGWVDKLKDAFVIKYNEEKDTVEFTVNGYLEYAQRFSGNRLCCQIKNDDVDESGTDGICLAKIPGIFVTDANISGYVLKKGIHTITYDYNSGSPHAKLDEGEWIALSGSSGFVELENLNEDEEVDQKVRIYFILANLSPSSSEIKQKIIVLNAGDTLPYTWYSYIYIFNVLKNLFALVGIQEYSFDSFRLNTRDGRKTISFYEIPPGGDTYVGRPRCILWDDANERLWLGVGAHVYYRNMTTRAYTDIGVISSGYEVIRLFGDRISNDELWGIAAGSSGVKAFCITISTGAYASWTLPGRGTTEDLEFGARNFAYAASQGTNGSFFYTGTSSGHIKYKFDLQSKSEQQIIVNGITALANLAGWSDGVAYFFIDVNMIIRRIYYTGGVWYEDAPNNQTLISNLGEDALYNPSENVTIISDVNGSIIQSYDHTTLTLSTVSNEKSVTNLTLYNNKIYGIFWDAADTRPGYIQSGSITLIEGEYLYSNGVLGSQFGYEMACNGFVYNPTDDCYYGLLDPVRLLFTYDTRISMFVEDEIDAQDKTLIDIMKELCIGFNLRPRVSTTKKCHILRRADDDGSVITSGDSLELNADRAKDLTEDCGASGGAAIVSVKNKTDETNYDGTDFDVVALDNEIIQTIDNVYIPTRLLKDYAYWYYQYFKNVVTRYLVPTPLIPYLQYEPFDAADLNFSGKINTLEESVPKRGIIVGQSISRDGSTEFEVEI